MDHFTSRLRLVRPLELAENHFLEVLITNFTLSRQRKGIGTKLKVEFDNDTSAIWSRHAKYDVQKMVPDFVRRATDHQRRLDTFLLDGNGYELIISDQSFPFRYASGGTLPIIRMGKKEYFCLFYRDINPIGWNIANGACDNRNELINPLDAVERELGEELIILDPTQKERYVFEWNEGKRIDRPEFSVARKIWTEKFRDYDVSDFKEEGIALKWLEGPDSLLVKDISRSQEQTTEGCFLNINAIDFGIEIDRIAKINIKESAILCDGEMTQGVLLDRIVGLFPVTDFRVDDIRNSVDYRPEIYFYNGRFYNNNNQLERTIREFMENLRHNNIRTLEETEHYEHTKRQFSLCPVTRSLLLRYLQMCEQTQAERNDTNCDVFISFGSEDENYANSVYSYLRNAGRRVFFSTESISTCDYHAEIDEAIQSARYLVAVGSNPQHLKKHWVCYECRAFNIMRANQRENELKELFSFITGFDCSELPLPLRVYQAISFQPENLESGLNNLSRFIR